MGPDHPPSGSTTSPRWVISTSPDLASRRAASRASSINSRQLSPPTARAASEGQMLLLGPRCSASARIDDSSRCLIGPSPRAISAWSAPRPPPHDTRPSSARNRSLTPPVKATAPPTRHLEPRPAWTTGPSCCSRSPTTPARAPSTNSRRKSSSDAQRRPHDVNLGWHPKGRSCSGGRICNSSSAARAGSGTFATRARGRAPGCRT